MRFGDDLDARVGLGKLSSSYALYYGIGSDVYETTRRGNPPESESFAELVSQVRRPGTALGIAILPLYCVKEDLKSAALRRICNLVFNLRARLVINA
jgi:hypothetical protein